jgi:hypothetical protein
MRDHLDHARRAGHRECWELLPWLVNESLTEAQKQRLEGHLEQCDSCRREAQEQELLREHMRREEAVLYAPQASFQALLNRIDDPRSGQVPRPVEYHHGSRPAKLLAAAVAVGALAIIGISSVSAWRLREERFAARYSTLTSSPEVVARVPAARVVFAPTMSLAQLSELLRTYNAQVVTGPSDAGVYTLMFVPRTDDQRAAHTNRDDGRAPGDTASMEALVAAAIPALRKDPNVLFAEPVIANGGAGG